MDMDTSSRVVVLVTLTRRSHDLKWLGLAHFAVL